jgi:excinuclease ABC subunit A
MQRDEIVIKGARVHNLDSVELNLPRNRLICLTGVSGSGKSSLAFDTLYAEGQRRYMESLSIHARQFFNQLPRPEVDSIDGLSPAIAIGQQTTGWNPRSTVGTITGIYDLLRVLFARVGQPFCPKCGRKITSQTQDQIIAMISEMAKGLSRSGATGSLPALAPTDPASPNGGYVGGTKPPVASGGGPSKIDSGESAFAVLAPVVRGQRGHWKDLFEQLRRDGYMRARVDGHILATDPAPNLDRNRRHDIDVVVDRLPAGAGRGRIAEAVEQALKLGQGQMILTPMQQGSAQIHTRNDRILSTLNACGHCGIGLPALSPQLFSFNSPQGMCLECDGLGERHDFDPDLLVADPSQTLFRGAIPVLRPPIGRWRRHIYRGVAKRFGFDLSQPWKDLPAKARRILLYGAGGKTELDLEWRGFGGTWRHSEVFEGIIPELREKYKTTNSGIARLFYEKFMTRQPCTACNGARLNPQALAVRIDGRNIAELCDVSVSDVRCWLGQLALQGSAAVVAEDLVKELKSRLTFLLDVGLGYLTLGRRAPTLAGGEAQRVRLAGQIGGGLVGAMYILDEPSIGLHARDNAQLLKTLARLRDVGNTVVVVEHDEATIRAADYVVDFGPGAGSHGGKVTAAGGLDAVLAAPASLTGQYLSGQRRIEIPKTRRPVREGHWLEILGACHNNLKNIDVKIPLGCFVVVTGVSGSGKSSLVNDTLAVALRNKINESDAEQPGRHKAILGADKLDKVLMIDQSPIGRTPRSNPATYIKVFDLIRDLYARLPDSRVRGYKPGRFSFNVPAEEGGGRCEACQGHGARRMEMDFLADVWVTCPVCEGKRFAAETLQIYYKAKTISDVLAMTIEQAAAHFANVPKIKAMLDCLLHVGLGYMELGQSSTTLSGGEAQRIKLARELVKRSTGRTLYILDEPTTGLHFEDIRKLLEILHGFVDAGNTVLVVEHNMDIIKTADWLIDLGPEGGEDGGRVIATGTPEQVAVVTASHTGRALLDVLPDNNGNVPPPIDWNLRLKTTADTVESDGRIRVIGARQNNLKDVTVDIPRHRMTVCTGVSGSGKSSFALETVYSEGQRRYVESLSTYARQFVGRLAKPKVERIEGLSPAVAIEQKGTARSPRSTVATITEIYDYMRLLWARLGTPYCPDCQVPIQRMTVDEIAEDIVQKLSEQPVTLFAPVQPKDTQRWADLWGRLRAAGFARARIDGRLGRIEEMAAPAEGRHHVVEVAIDRLQMHRVKRSRLIDSLEQAIGLSEGVVVAEADGGSPSLRYSINRTCRSCGKAFEELSPHHFSYNSPLGWCPTCEGLGVQQGTNVESVVIRPDRGLLDGAILGWGRIGRSSPQGKLISAVARAIGFDIGAPWKDLDHDQQNAVLYGLPGTWIDGAALAPGMRFEWKGLFPAIEEASRISWHYRKRLADMALEVPCRHCKASRLRPDAAAVRLADRTIGQVCAMSLREASSFFRQLRLPRHHKRIGGELLREVINRLNFLLDVGLDYLTLGRSGPTLSGGEAQRIRLACQLGSGLTGVLYVLDEPTIGLHPIDNARLLAALKRLRDLGNTLLLVEHDREVIRAGDHVLDFGPGAGQAGGRIVAQGAPDALGSQARREAEIQAPCAAGGCPPAASGSGIATDSPPAGATGSLPARALADEPPAAPEESLTVKYLSGREAIEIPLNRRPVSFPLNPDEGTCLVVRGARQNNLKNIDVAFPLGRFVAVTGVSGSGKSSLVTETLWPALARRLQGAKTTPGAFDTIDGLERIDKVISVDQSPIGQTPASNAATYTGLFDEIRKLFARLPAARMRGFTPGRFSCNRAGGRCEDCEGLGAKCVQMHFLPDVWVTCETCGGKRFNEATLEVTFHGKNINDVLNMSVAEASNLFQDVPKLRRILQTLLDVGLDYLPLGQSGTTLSGGEAQRVKLAAELARPQTGRTLYILDEPTTGLHFDDIRKLLAVVHRLVDQGNTVICIEHNLDLIKQADWVIDLGPGPAERGGEVVVEGTPETVAACKDSLTGKVLKPILDAGPYLERQAFDPKAAACKAFRGLRKGTLPGDESWPVPETPERGATDEPGATPAVSAGVPSPTRKNVGGTRRQGSDRPAPFTDWSDLPWKKDGQGWHLEQRHRGAAEPRRWDAEALRWLIQRVEQVGGKKFEPTDWANVAHVEIRGKGAAEPADWFLHVRTGGPDVFDACFRVPGGTFDEAQLIQQLAVPPFDRGPDAPPGGWQRVQVRTDARNIQSIRIQVADLRDIRTKPFEAFVQQAVKAYLKGLRISRAKQKSSRGAKWDRRAWHMAGKATLTGRRPKWSTAMLAELCGLLTKCVPQMELDWAHKTGATMFSGTGKRLGRIITNKPDAITVWLFAPAGAFAAKHLPRLDAGAWIEEDTEDGMQIRMRLIREKDLTGDLRDFLRRWAAVVGHHGPACPEPSRGAQLQDHTFWSDTDAL